VKKRSVTFWRKFHGWLTIFWAVMLPISLITGLKNSLPYIVGLSVYALMGTHFAAWQGSRAEDSNNV